MFHIYTLTEAACFKAEVILQASRILPIEDSKTSMCWVVKTFHQAEERGLSLSLYSRFLASDPPERRSNKGLAPTRTSVDVRNRVHHLGCKTLQIVEYTGSIVCFKISWETLMNVFFYGLFLLRFFRAYSVIHVIAQKETCNRSDLGLKKVQGD